jgi:hypothetical protein
VRWVGVSDSFLGNGYVNTFPRQRFCMQGGTRGVVCAVRAEEVLRTELGQAVHGRLRRDGATVQLTVEFRSARAAVIRGSEHTKLKNLRC